MKFMIRFEGAVYANELYNRRGGDEFESEEEAREWANEEYKTDEFELWGR